MSAGGEGERGVEDNFQVLRWSAFRDGGVLKREGRCLTLHLMGLPMVPFQCEEQLPPK